MPTIKNLKPGDRLKTVIKKRGYTQEQFANAIGIGLTQLKECISGKKNLEYLPYDVLIKISEKLEIDIGYMFGVAPFTNYKENTIYGYIKSLSGFDIQANPKDEDQIYIKYNDMELYTDMETIESKIKEAILFQMFLENQK